MMEAALDWMAEGRSFDSLSIREVTKRVGIVPAAFYRHFTDVNDLGLMIVEDCGSSLRKQLRKVRKTKTVSWDIIQESVLIFKKYVEKHPKHFLIVFQGVDSNFARVLAAVQKEMDAIIDEMARDLNALQLLPGCSLSTIRNVCEIVVRHMLAMAHEILCYQNQGPTAKIPQKRVECYIQQVSIVFMGAAAWRD